MTGNKRLSDYLKKYDQDATAYAAKQAQKERDGITLAKQITAKIDTDLTFQRQIAATWIYELQNGYQIAIEAKPDGTVIVRREPPGTDGVVCDNEGKALEALARLVREI